MIWFHLFVVAVISFPQHSFVTSDVFSAFIGNKSGDDDANLSGIDEFLSFLKNNNFIIRNSYQIKTCITPKWSSVASYVITDIHSIRSSKYDLTAEINGTKFSRKKGK